MSVLNDLAAATAMGSPVALDLRKMVRAGPRSRLAGRGMERGEHYDRWFDGDTAARVAPPGRDLGDRVAACLAARARAPGAGRGARARRRERTPRARPLGPGAALPAAAVPLVLDRVHGLHDRRGPGRGG